MIAVASSESRSSIYLYWPEAMLHGGSVTHDWPGTGVWNRCTSDFVLMK